jgi:glyoxylase-like metal-dependent hydrolase (beta-lactamase superfamily II)
MSPPRRCCALLAAVIVTPLAMSAGSAQRGPAPDPLVRANATINVAPHTYVIPDGNVPLVPNVGIVVGSTGTLVIDPGLGRLNGETVLAEVAKVSRNANLYIASTHFHPEHTTGYIAFPPSAKYINSTAQEQEFAESGMSMVRAFSGRSPRTAEILKDAARRPADITFDREYTLDLGGGVVVHFVVVGPAHTRADTGFFVDGDRVLFAGDVVMNQSFLAAGGATSMKAWLTAFDTFDAFKPQVIVPSHGAIGTGDLIGQNRAIMLEIQSRAGALKREGRSADEAASTVQQELQAAHPGWPRANGIAAAARSAYAEAP